MPCASIQVRWNFLWIARCMTPVKVVGWSCRWSLLMLIILGGSTWVLHSTLKEFSIAMLGHYQCSPQYHIHRRLTVSLLMVWQRICCWLRPPWLWHVVWTSSIVGDLGDAMVRSVAVPIFSLSSVSGVACLRSIVLVARNVLRDWASQSTIPVYLF